MVFLLTSLWVSGFIMAPALAQGGNPPIKIRVESILATNRGAGAGRQRPIKIEMDKRLKQLNIADRLTTMVGYSNYHLLRHQEDSAGLGDAVAFNLPGGHILHVCLLGFRDNLLKVDVALFEGERVIMSMPMRIVGESGMLMLVDEHSPDQYYITAISADAPQFRTPSKAASEPREMPPMSAFPVLIPVY